MAPCPFSSICWSPALWCFSLGPPLNNKESCWLKKDSPAFRAACICLQTYGGKHLRQWPGDRVAMFPVLRPFLLEAVQKTEKLKALVACYDLFPRANGEPEHGLPFWKQNSSMPQQRLPTCHLLETRSPASLTTHNNATLKQKLLSSTSRWSAHQSPPSQLSTVLSPLT